MEKGTENPCIFAAGQKKGLNSPGLLCYNNSKAVYYWLSKIYLGEWQTGSLKPPFLPA